MTNLVRYSPNYDLHQMQREIDRLFHGFFQATDGNGETKTAVWSPRVDFVENEEAYMILLDLPGMTKDDLEISFQEGRLTVSGDRPVHTWDDGVSAVRLERASGPFYRSFHLPKMVADDKIEARFEHGVLRIDVPKAEESKPRRIQIS